MLLRNLIDKKIHAVEKRLNADINYTEAKFSGISTVNISDFTLVPLNSDTLLFVHSVSVGIKPLDLILQRIRISNLAIDSTLIHLRRQGLESNYLFLLQSTNDSTSADTLKNDPETDYGARISSLFTALFDHVPSTSSIRNFTLKANIDSNNFSFTMNELRIRDNDFNTQIRVQEADTTNMWHVTGHIDRTGRDFKIKVTPDHANKIYIPYITKRWNTVFAFDSAEASISYKRINNQVTHFSGKAVLSGPLINHPRISPDNIELNNSEIDFSLNIGKTYFEVDSSTLVSFNETGFHPYVLYNLKPDKELTLKINEPRFNAQAFFNSLPYGLFTNLQGIKVRGDLSFYLNFYLPFSNPDSLVFSSQFRGIDFAVERFGKTDFTYINDPFIYTAYENGQPVRQITVGRDNSQFRSLDEIPEHVKHAIMTSEDGAFYYHNGFVPDAIRYSIITNIKEKRFARGGSTITMQLVKNIFLNRNKNITRKLEEMLITWLIESKRMVTKDRMLEVYLNIIETGPMVYGINEAAQFYFRKDVSKLTLAESIYIASIVPRPKLYRYSFDKEGNLREYLASYYSLVSGKMLSRGWLTQQEFDELQPVIVLKGPARSTIVTDSVPPEEETIIERKGFLKLFDFNFLKKKDKEESK